MKTPATTRFESSSSFILIFLLLTGQITRPILAGNVLYLDLVSSTTGTSGTPPVYSGTFPGFSMSYSGNSGQINTKASFSYASTYDLYTLVQASKFSTSLTKTYGQIATSSYSVVESIMTEASISFSMTFGWMMTTSGADVIQALFVTDGTSTYLLANYPTLAITGAAGNINTNGNSNCDWTVDTDTIFVIQIFQNSGTSPLLVGRVPSASITTTTTTTTTTSSATTTVNTNSASSRLSFESNWILTLGLLFLILFKQIVF